MELGCGLTRVLELGLGAWRRGRSRSPRPDGLLGASQSPEELEEAGAATSQDEALVEESRIIRRAQAGDEGAFQELVERYQRLAYVWALQKVGNREDALDVAQDTFVRVYRGLHRFDPTRRFATWLYRIVANLSIDCLRRRRACRVQPGLGELAEEQPADDATWLEAEARQDEIDQVYLCLDRLPPRYREIIILRDIENIPAREIARSLGLTHATVRWRLHQGRKLFKEIWERLVLRRTTMVKELS